MISSFSSSSKHRNVLALMPYRESKLVFYSLLQLSSMTITNQVHFLLGIYSIFIGIGGNSYYIYQELIVILCFPCSYKVYCVLLCPPKKQDGL